MKITNPANKDIKEANVTKGESSKSNNAPPELKVDDDFKLKEKASKLKNSSHHLIIGGTLDCSSDALLAELTKLPPHLS